MTTMDEEAQGLMTETTMGDTVPDEGLSDEGQIWLNIGLTPTEFRTLDAHALGEKRSAEAQGEVFILMALGLWPQAPTTRTPTTPRTRPTRPPRVRASRAKSANGAKA